MSFCLCLSHTEPRSPTANFHVTCRPLLGLLLATRMPSLLLGPLLDPPPWGALPGFPASPILLPKSPSSSRLRNIQMSTWLNRVFCCFYRWEPCVPN